IMLGYALPVYGHLGRSAPWHGHRWLGWIPLGVAAGTSLMAAVAARRADVRHLVAAVGVAYGLVHYVAQAKGSEYHLYPLAAFVFVLAFSGLVVPRAWVSATSAVALAAALVLVTAKGLEAAESPW